MENLQGRTAFVTGAAGGIGAGIAGALVDAGARLVIADVDEEALEEQAEALGGNAAPFVLDVTDRERWPAAKAFVEARFGPLDILVNNAGVGGDLQFLDDVPPDTFERLVRIKLFGTFNGIHTFAAGLRERGRGHIVNTASMQGLMTGGPRMGAYAAAKHAVVGLSEVLRAEMAPHGVGVSVLCPGIVSTRLSATTRAITGRTLTAATAGISEPGVAIDPSVVGELVVDAIRTGRFYVLTHGEYRERVEARATELLAAFEGVPRRGG